MAPTLRRTTPARWMAWSSGRAFPAGGDSLAAQDALVVTSIYGTLDGLATPEKVLGAKPLLPAGTRFIPIEGGNHAIRLVWRPGGDNPATISR